MCMFHSRGPIEMASTPYNIARIIEFLPPHTSPKKGSRIAPSSDVMVRLALYYRPSDISARNFADFRLLLAAIHTDIQPISNVRGKCYVRHKDRIPDLLEWKRLPDHFYFTKFFDPYIKREFEVIRTANVNNIPSTVKDVLMRRYEYLITEREMVADLTDDFRICCCCRQWSSFQDSVKCESCREYYHMTCLQPPLLAKPAKGYSWVCPSCFFQRNTQQEGQKLLLHNNSSGTGKLRAAKTKIKSNTLDFTPDTMFRGWPWRYFGYVRSGRRNISPGRYSLADYMEQVKSLRLAVPPWDVERINLALFSYTSMGREAAYRFMCHTVLSDFHPVHFTEEESTVFEAELERNGGLDVISCSKILKRTTSDILRFSYIWKNNKLKDENEALRQHRRVSVSHARQNRTLGAPSLGKMRIGDKSKVEDDETSLYGSSTGESTMRCATCSTKLGQVWWRSPRTVPGIAMCESCGSNYRKYGVISFVRSEDSKKLDRREHVTKKGKSELSDQPAGSLWSSKHNQCACCRRAEPKSQLARCRNCNFVAHAGCYGTALLDQNSDWECDLCVNEKTEECHVEPHCVLCPRTPRLAMKVKRKAAEYDLLTALKPSEGRRWAHLLCSTWTNGVEYGDTVSFKQIEGIMSIRGDIWAATCSLCGQNDGAVIKCSDCDIQFHVSCAWQCGFTLGFEFNLAKPGKSQTQIVTRFKENEGVMNAGAWCKSHDLNNRIVYDIFDVEPDSGETAFQVYIRAYKSATWHSAFPLLRKAIRLELITQSPSNADSPENIEANVVRCDSCGVLDSPMWHKHDTETVPSDETPCGDPADDSKSVSKFVVNDERRPEGRQLCHLCWCTDSN
uniref:ZNF1 n=1 Tax=Cryptococcus deneoformans TaxID=40410 RepID=Q8J0X8_9TREE|nr:ZNF1 [Cryptococcus neoformans var. neoformans]